MSQVVAGDAADWVAITAHVCVRLCVCACMHLLHFFSYNCHITTSALNKSKRKQQLRCLRATLSCSSDSAPDPQDSELFFLFRHVVRISHELFQGENAQLEQLIVTLAVRE